jgi:hypothetical protein
VLSDISLTSLSTPSTLDRTGRGGRPRRHEQNRPVWETFAERVCHTRVKHLLRTQERLEDYATWKLGAYRRFCPEFNWAPIPEKSAA